MVAEACEENELPTKDGRNGPWAVIGNNLCALVNEAYEFLIDFIDPYNETESSKRARASIAKAT